jgi:hypothetical protein
MWVPATNLCWFYVFILAGKNRNFQFFFLKFQIFVADIALFRYASQLSFALQDIHLQLPGSLEAEQGAEADGALPKAGSCRPAERGWRFDEIFSPGFWLLGPWPQVEQLSSKIAIPVFKAPKAINGQHQDPQDSKTPPELGGSVVDLFMNWEKTTLGACKMKKGELVLLPFCSHNHHKLLLTTDIL